MNREERRQHLQPKIPLNKTKWVGIGLGAIFGISHIGMIGMLATRSRLPVVNLPVGPYTSYHVNAGEKGYTINYRANDPLVMEVTKDVNRPGGFLGFGKTKIRTRELYTMDGSQHLGDRDSGNISAAQAKCLKAEGGGEQTGRLVGGSIGAATATTGLASIPFVGWVLAGAATMIGMDQGAEIGGQMAKDFADC